MRLLKVLTVARWETSRHFSTIDRRTVLMAVASIGVLALLLTGSMLVPTGSVDEGIYKVSVDESSPYYDVVANSETLTVVHPGKNIGGGVADPEVRITNGSIHVVDSREGRAAVSELRREVQAYNRQNLRNEPNQQAAFPVTVDLNYVEVEDLPADQTVSMNATGGGSSGSAENTASPNGNRGLLAKFLPEIAQRLPVIGDGDSSGGDRFDSTPGNISPPFPFTSMLLALAFVVPLNFIVQAYGSSIIEERLNRRGELMLVTPLSRFEIIAGKTLPYACAMIATMGFISLLFGGGIFSVAATLPFVTLFLALGLLAAMLARSFKELTFITVTISVVITSYAFIPAIFTEIHPIAIISPLTLVVQHLERETVTLIEYVFSTGPLYLVSLVLFALGAGMYREEDMFAQRRLPLKAVDALATYTTRLRRIPFITAALLPLAFVAELLLIAVVFILPQSLALIVLLCGVALFEELVKSGHIYAGFSHSKFGDRSIRTAVIAGSLSGLGFFVAEKATVIVQTVGLMNMGVGRAAFSSAAPPVSGPIGVLFLLLAPLALHCVTATISALGARKNTRAYALAVTIAIAVHLGYNLTVVTNFGV